MITDLRLAFRRLARSPGFTAVIVLTLALGIGANTAIFSIFNAILLQALPFADPERLVIFKKGVADFSEPMGVELGLLAADFRDLQPQTRMLQEMATYTLDSATLTGRGTPDLAVGAVVSPNFFSLLGARAAVGRTFSAGDTNGRNGRLAVVSHRYWQSRLGGNPAVIGQTLTLNHVPLTIVGVMSPDFEFPREAVFWATPAGVVPENAIGLPVIDFGGRGNYLRSIVGRLRPGVSRAQAEQELAALVDRLPNPNAVKRSVHLVSLRDQTVGNVRPALLALLGCVGLVLAIACLNVANLMLSRAISREREIGIRLALGSGRGRIAWQLLTESVVLALVGGAAGVLLGAFALDLLVRLAPADLPRLSAVRIDAPVLGFAFAVSLLTGLICGLAPVWGTARSDLVTATKSGDRGVSAGAVPRRLRAGLVAGEVTISLVLLVAAGLLLRSLEKMQAVSWGFDPVHVVSARVAFLDDRYGEDAPRIVFYRTLLDKLAAVPGFDAVGTSLDRIGQTWIHLPFAPEGHTYVKPSDAPQANYHVGVSPDYFRALGITLVQGRTFAPRDDAKIGRLVIIDAATANRFFPGGQAVSKRIKVPSLTGDEWAEVIGVVANVKSDGPAAATLPDIYMSYLQVPTNNFFVHVRTRLDVATAGAIIKQAVQSIDEEVPVTDLASMQQVIAQPAVARSFPLGLLGAFAAIALALAAVGIYAITAYGVAQRTREIGVRMALGAQPRAVVGMILQQSFRPIAWGLAAGLAGGALTALAIRKLLFDIAPLDVPTFVAVPLVLAAIAGFASWLPARRATRVDPMIALRAE